MCKKQISFYVCKYCLRKNLNLGISIKNFQTTKYYPEIPKKEWENKKKKKKKIEIFKRNNFSEKHLNP